MPEAQYDWNAWLKQWNDLLIERINPDDYPHYKPSMRHAVETGWLGSEGSTEEQIAELETRLGKRLPPSYRQFLRASNGFLQVSMLVPRLFSCDEVAWLRVIEAESFDTWLEWRARDAQIQDEDDTNFFLQDIESMVVISEEEESGSARYFLNAAQVDEDGEWEAYYYAHWQPGATRYRSFWHLMQREFEFRLNYVD